MTLLKAQNAPTILSNISVLVSRNSTVDIITIFFINTKFNLILGATTEEASFNKTN